MTAIECGVACAVEEPDAGTECAYADDVREYEVPDLDISEARVPEIFVSTRGKNPSTRSSCAVAAA